MKTSNGGGGLGRRAAPDDRDKNFLLRAVVPTPPPERYYRYWWQSGWWGDQGGTSQCVAYSWMHLLEDSPITYSTAGPVLDPALLYAEAQRVDEWPGEGYDGTSVRAGAKVLVLRGHIQSYTWAFSVDDVIRALLMSGPVVLGTNWYAGMDSPDSEGIVHVTGGIRGGHAYKADGINTRREIVRCKNSWGRGWGNVGRFHLSFDDLDRLIKEEGEACMPIEIRKEA
jgi:hypothetical protein